MHVLQVQFHYVFTSSFDYFCLYECRQKQDVNIMRWQSSEVIYRDCYIMRVTCFQWSPKLNLRMCSILVAFFSHHILGIILHGNGVFTANTVTILIKENINHTISLILQWTAMIVDWNFFCVDTTYDADGFSYLDGVYLLFFTSRPGKKFKTQLDKSIKLMLENCDFLPLDFVLYCKWFQFFPKFLSFFLSKLFSIKNNKK